MEVGMKQIGAKDWIRHHERWKESGRTQREYCDEAGLKYTTFRDQNYQLRKRLRGRKAKGVDLKTDKGKFQEVKILSEGYEKDDRHSREAYCEIRFRGEHHIHISSQEALIRMKEVMRCLIS